MNLAEQLRDPAWAWSPYEPGPEKPWTLRQAGHLYRRANWGANWGQLQQAVVDGPQRAVEQLLTPPQNLTEFNRTFDDYERPDRDAAGSENIRAWWLRRMLETPFPLLENLTLFWHNHFAISNAHVENAGLMAKHIQAIRRHAVGDFPALLEAIAASPAVFAGLEAKANRKAQPSEHFARALLEQFTVGPGNFTEQDVHEVARAFTGWFVKEQDLQFLEHEHDVGPKQILGEKGALGSRDVVRILVHHPATAENVVRKLYRWFISETTTPSSDLLKPLVAEFSKNFSISKLVGTVLRSNLFFASERQKIKSPVEFAVGILKGMEATVSTTHLATALADLGQDLYEPPTVKGWPGQDWLNPFAWAGRTRLAEALLSSTGPYANKLDPARMARLSTQQSGSASKLLYNVYLQQDLPDGRTSTAQGFRDECLRIFAAPEFHLA